DVVELRDQASAGCLGNRVCNRRRSRFSGKQARATCKRADLLGGVIVIGLNGQVAVGVDRGLQVIGRQCRVQAVEIMYLAGGGAERDVGRQAVADSGDVQNRADREVRGRIW